MITIHYDFTDGTELSWIEGRNKGDAFTTNVLDFFTSDRNVIVVKKDGSYISSVELLANDPYYTDKHMRPAHNIHKMLVANGFRWKPKDYLKTS